MNPLVQRGQINGPKDLVDFIIMTLHEELNKPPKLQISTKLFENAGGNNEI